MNLREFIAKKRVSNERRKSEENARRETLAGKSVAKEGLINGVKLEFPVIQHRRD